MDYYCTFFANVKDDILLENNELHVEGISVVGFDRLNHYLRCKPFNGEAWCFLHPFSKGASYFQYDPNNKTYRMLYSKNEPKKIHDNSTNEIILDYTNPRWKKINDRSTGVLFDQHGRVLFPSTDGKDFYIAFHFGPKDKRTYLLNLFQQQKDTNRVFLCSLKQEQRKKFKPNPPMHQIKSDEIQYTSLGIALKIDCYWWIYDKEKQHFIRHDSIQPKDSSLWVVPVHIYELTEGDIVANGSGTYYYVTCKESRMQLVNIATNFIVDISTAKHDTLYNKIVALSNDDTNENSSISRKRLLQLAMYSTNLSNSSVSDENNPFNDVAAISNNVPLF